mgnify:CR=1 FL=1
MHDMAADLSLTEEADTGASAFAVCRVNCLLRFLLALQYCFYLWIFVYVFLLGFVLVFLCLVRLRSVRLSCVAYVVCHTVRNMVLKATTVADANTVWTEQVRTT